MVNTLSTVKTLFAIIARGSGQGKERALLESHREYLDIQYVIAGPDEIGWRHTFDCFRPTADFDTGRDVGFYYDRPQTWLTIPAQSFAIFLPDDAHAPLASYRFVHKVVVKIRL